MDRNGELVEVATSMWTNLLLLGFDPGQVDSLICSARWFNIRDAAASHSTKTRVPFGATMFNTRNASSAACEAVIGFLIGHITARDTKTAKEFNSCYPFYSTDQKKDFKKLVLSVLIKLQQDEHIPASPPVRSSLLDSPGGHQ